MEYQADIGLEIHVQLLTESKLFCGCSTKFGALPNTQTCPVCLGLPGVLPVINKKAVQYTLKTALALNCQILEFCKFDRKNYFYPDLPKNFQISQYDKPFARKGYLDIVIDGKQRRVGIHRVHLEEDAGKLIHLGQIDTAEASLVDFNRAGIPLMEIVSEPDIHSPEEAYEFLITLKNILQYLEVSDCNMEEGSLRCDANISMRPMGREQLGTKTELKNMNSFRFVQKALDYEIRRQVKMLREGGKVVQETRLWDPDKEITTSMRGKEAAHDYRYFPEPDLVPVVIERSWIEEILRSLPELPPARRERLMREYGLPFYDANLLTSSKAIADYYEEAVRLFNDPKTVSNWIMGDLQALLKTENIEITNSPLTPKHLAEMLELLKGGVISGRIAKVIFEEMFRTGKRALDIVKEKGLVQITDEGEIAKFIDRVIAENPRSVEEYRKGKEKALTHLVGQVMKLTKGRANPQIVNRILKEKLSS